MSTGTVLLIEDSHADIVLTCKLMQRQNFICDLKVVRGLSELEALLDSPQFQLSPPLLALLDFNLPSVSGLEILERFQSNDLLCKVPVVMLSGSDAAVDKKESLQRGAVGFLTKPFSLKQMREIGRHTKSFTIISDGTNSYLQHNR